MATSRKTQEKGLTPYTRVIVAVDKNGKIIASKVVHYRSGCDIPRFYKRLSGIEKQFKNTCGVCRVYTGTADSVSGFLSLFPEVSSPFSEP